MADKAQQWQKEFQKLKTEANKAQADLQKWELLGSASQAQKGDRAALGANLRVSFQKLKNDAERLKCQLDALPQKEATQKTITQWQDEMANLTQELSGAQQILSRKASGIPRADSGAHAVAPSTASFASNRDPATSSSTRGTGAEMQNVSNRALLENQQQTMRDIEASLEPLEGTVNNLALVGNMINREIRAQNEMLENTNEQADRVKSRMDRAREMLGRVAVQDKTRALGCIVLVLFGVLVFLVVSYLLR